MLQYPQWICQRLLRGEQFCLGHCTNCAECECIAYLLKSKHATSDSLSEVQCVQYWLDLFFLLYCFVCIVQRLYIVGFFGCFISFYFADPMNDFWSWRMTHRTEKCSLKMGKHRLIEIHVFIFVFLNISVIYALANNITPVI